MFDEYARSTWSRPTAALLLVAGLGGCVEQAQAPSFGSIRFDIAGASTKVVVLGTAGTPDAFEDLNTLRTREPAALALLAPAEHRVFVVGIPRTIGAQIEALRANVNLPESKAHGLSIDGVVPTDLTDATFEGMRVLAARPAERALRVFAPMAWHESLNQGMARRGFASSCTLVELPTDRPMDLCSGLSLRAVPQSGGTVSFAFAIRGARRSLLYAPNLAASVDPFFLLREPLANASIALLASAPFEAGAVPPAAATTMAETTSVRALLTCFSPDHTALDPSSPLRAQLAALGVIVIDDGVELWL